MQKSLILCISLSQKERRKEPTEKCKQYFVCDQKLRPTGYRLLSGGCSPLLFIQFVGLLCTNLWLKREKSAINFGD
ncbi:unnamed protein product [Victoria cruziana]